MSNNGSRSSTPSVYSESINPGGLVVFCDVDNTLLYEAAGVKDVLNMGLVEAWKKAGIKEIYLFTSMGNKDVSSYESAKKADENAKNRDDIIRILRQEHGINVKGVVTTSDLDFYAAYQLAHPSFSDLMAQDIPTGDRTTQGMTYRDVLTENFSQDLKVDTTSDLVQQAMSTLERMYNEFANKYNSNENISSFIGTYYDHYIAPFYQKVNTSESGDFTKSPEFVAARYFEQVILGTYLKEEKHKNLNSLHLGVPGAVAEKALLAKLIQDDAQKAGLPIKNYIMIDDAFETTIEVPKIRSGNTASSGLHVEVLKIDEEVYLGNHLLSIQKGDPTKEFSAEEKRIMDYAEQFSHADRLSRLLATTYVDISREAIGRGSITAKNPDAFVTRLSELLAPPQSDRFSPKELQNIRFFHEQLSLNVELSQLIIENRKNQKDGASPEAMQATLARIQELSQRQLSEDHIKQKIFELLSEIRTEFHETRLANDPEIENKIHDIDVQIGQLEAQLNSPPFPDGMHSTLSTLEKGVKNANNTFEDSQKNLSTNSEKMNILNASLNQHQDPLNRINSKLDNESRLARIFRPFRHRAWVRQQQHLMGEIAKINEDSFTASTRRNFDTARSTFATSETNLQEKQLALEAFLATFTGTLELLQQRDNLVSRLSELSTVRGQFSQQKTNQEKNSEKDNIIVEFLRRLDPNASIESAPSALTAPPEGYAIAASSNNTNVQFIPQTTSHTSPSSSVSVLDTARPKSVTHQRDNRASRNIKDSEMPQFGQVSELRKKFETPQSSQPSEPSKKRP